MVLIFSEKNDQTTNKVIQWFLYYNKAFIRINDDEIFEIQVENRRLKLVSRSNCFFIDEITSVWFRRGGLKIKYLEYDNAGLNDYMFETQFWIKDYILYKLEQVKTINKESKSTVNKLIVLEYAEKIGLSVPQYFLSNSTDGLEMGDFVTKTINGNGTVDLSDNVSGWSYTTVLDQNLDFTFYPTLFQNLIEKKFEIRSFYLNGNIWSMAIISQLDQSTAIDYRHYNKENPNRNIPYKLPFYRLITSIHIGVSLSLRCIGAGSLLSLCAPVCHSAGISTNYSLLGLDSCGMTEVIEIT